MTVAARTVIERETTGMELALVLDNTGSMWDSDTKTIHAACPSRRCRRRRRPRRHHLRGRERDRQSLGQRRALYVQPSTSAPATATGWRPVTQGRPTRRLRHAGLEGLRPGADHAARHQLKGRLRRRLHAYLWDVRRTIDAESTHVVHVVLLSERASTTTISGRRSRPASPTRTRASRLTATRRAARTSAAARRSRRSLPSKATIKAGAHRDEARGTAAAPPATSASPGAGARSARSGAASGAARRRAPIRSTTAPLHGEGRRDPDRRQQPVPRPGLGTTPARPPRTGPRTAGSRPFRAVNSGSSAADRRAQGRAVLDTRMAEHLRGDEDRGDPHLSTITFGGSPDPTAQALFRACATTPAMYWHAPDAATLSTAFRAIGGQLANLRIVE